MFKKTLVVATLLGVIASPALATPFTISNGIDFGSNGNTSTSALDTLGYTGTLATSIYLGNPAVAGTAVVDTNIASVMDSYGFAAGAHTSLNGTALSFGYPANPAGMNIDALNTPVDGNGFSNGTPFAYGFSGTWGLTYQYVLNGVTTANDILYNSGYLNVFYENGGAAQQVLRLNVTGSQTQIANLKITGLVSYDFNGDGDSTDANETSALVKNFFRDATTGTSFYDNAGFNPLSVSWDINTNVNPPLPTASQLWSAPGGALIRQSALNGEVSFNVPEPGSIALLGAALLGLGFSRRSAKNKS